MWQGRAEALSKQVKDLSTVIHKYIIKTKNNVTRTQAGPIRITRSVGLQVFPPENAAVRLGILHGRGREQPAHLRHKSSQGSSSGPLLPTSLQSAPRQSIPPIPTNNVPGLAPNSMRLIQPAPPKPAVKQPEVMELELSDEKEAAPPVATV